MKMLFQKRENLRHSNQKALKAGMTKDLYGLKGFLTQDQKPHNFKSYKKLQSFHQTRGVPFQRSPFHQTKLNYAFERPYAKS